MFKSKIINILGSEWTINFIDGSKSSILNYGRLAGLTQGPIRTITCDNFKYDKKYNSTGKNQVIKRVLRHELMHAFLYESGLCIEAGAYDGSWACNEEMIDWFAIQSPKIFKLYDELDILED